MKMKLIRRTAARAIYRLADFRRLTDRYLAGIKWPEGLNGMILTFGKKMPDWQKVMSALSGRHWVSLCYSVESRGLPRADMKLPAGFRAVKLRGPALRKLFCRTQAKFYAAWRAKLDTDYLKQSRAIAAGMLGTAKVACLKKNGKFAALLVVIKWKDYLDVPVNWVVWVWIDGKLPDEDRKAARRYLAGWMKKSLRGRIQCVVNSFNVRSHRFFSSLGFLPDCVHFIRKK